MIVYKTTNLINGKCYVGQDAHNKPNYLGSGILLNRAMRKHGKENFKKEIICTADCKEILNEKEIYWISYLNTKIPNGYNLTDGGDGFACGELNVAKRPEVREKISKDKIGKPRPDVAEHNKKFKSKQLKGRIVSQETVEKYYKKRMIGNDYGKANRGNFRPDLAEYNRRVKPVSQIVAICDYCGCEIKRLPSYYTKRNGEYNFCSKSHYGLYKKGKSNEFFRQST